MWLFPGLLAAGMIFSSSSLLVWWQCDASCWDVSSCRSRSDKFCVKQNHKHPSQSKSSILFFGPVSLRLNTRHHPTQAETQTQQLSAMKVQRVDHSSCFFSSALRLTASFTSKQKPSRKQRRQRVSGETLGWLKFSEDESNQKLNHST